MSIPHTDKILNWVAISNGIKPAFVPMSRQCWVVSVKCVDMCVTVCTCVSGMY